MAEGQTEAIVMAMTIQSLGDLPRCAFFLRIFSMDDVVLQIYKCGFEEFGGRLLRNGKEDGRVAECRSKNDVEQQAIDAGIRYDRVEILDRAPPPTRT